MNNLGKYVGKKRMFKKKFTRKRTNFRVRRQLSSDDSLRIKAEHYSGIDVLIGTALPTFDATGTGSFNIRSVLLSAPSFTDNASRYGRYRINGMSIRFDSNLITPNTILTCLPMPVIAFYPQTASVALGDAPLYNDKKAQFSCCTTTPQTKYWNFPNQFMDSSSGGYGVWNDTAGYSSILGMLGLTCYLGSANATATIRVGTIRITLYITLASRNS